MPSALLISAAAGLVLGCLLGWLWGRVGRDADLADALAWARAERAEAGRLRQENGRLRRDLGDAEGLLRVFEVVAGGEPYRAVRTFQTAANRQLPREVHRG